MSILIDGRAVAEQILHQCSEKLKDKRLALVYVGNDPASLQFIRVKKKMAEKYGVVVQVLELPAESTETEVTDAIGQLRDTSDGIVVQLPLPAHLDRDTVLSAIPHTHDIDVLHPRMYMGFLQNPLNAHFIAPVAGAVRALCEAYSIPIYGNTIAVIGLGHLVGKPVATLLHALGASLKVIDVDTPKAERTASIKSSRVLISGIGVPHSLTPSDISSDEHVLIDAGTSTDSGVTKGDVDPACYSRARAYTPVPGGVGPATVAYLLYNLSRT
jgi:methylenetetrahydrofolate dehydrogenase (NADP+) / methenyltetrahydrofolate cyclohydrolase